MTRCKQGLALGLAVPLLAVGCGAGVAGVVAGTSDSGGEGTAPTVLTSFQALDGGGDPTDNPKVSPATLRLRVSGAAPVEAALFYQRPGRSREPLSQLQGLRGNTVVLADPGADLSWDFAAEPLLDGSRFVDDVTLTVEFPGGALPDGGTLELSMGNDAPVIAVEDPPPEADGVVPIQFQLSDSSGDAVAIRVEFDVEGDALDWQPARPGGLDAEVPTPDLALTGIVAPADPGTELVFFWDTDSDLAELERDVRVRFTPIDPVVAGVTKETGTFRVDNNAAPIVQIFNDLVITNPDERRGIPIPFRVIDEEGDLVEVIFQWRREEEEFPSLDVNGDGEIESAELDALLADPVLRQERHVCTPYAHYAHGLVVPIDEDTVRLPELARSEAWILASGIVGRTLELLRPSSIPAPITPTWRSNPLVSPIAALPIGDGLTALVLDVPGNGRLREIELATGAVVREIATLGQGIPTAMAFERREKAVLVALDDVGTWRIERVELASGALTELIVSDGTEPGPVRGIASLGTNALVFTAGSSLLSLDYRDPLVPQAGRLLTNLATPWGVVVDPLPPDRIYVIERDANRVLAIELDSHGKIPVVVKTADMQLGTLDAPESLALERNGSRMLILTSAPGGGRQLLGLDLGATGGNRSFPIGLPTATSVASLATGPDQMRLLSLPTSNEFLVAGGIEQRSKIAAHSTSTQDAAVERPFDPVPSSDQPWRLLEEAQQLLRATAGGVVRRFVWDSNDAPGSAFVRATARDDEVGLAADGAAPKRVRGGLEVEPFALGGSGTTNSPVSVAAADLDGDGDQDLVSANQFSGDNLTVFFQLGPGSFTAAPLVLGGPGTTNRPSSVATADLDGDGDQDLVSANADFFAGNLTVFSQLAPGSFQASPLVLGFPGTMSVPESVVAADLDGDADLDLVSANTSSDDLTVFFQLGPGSFTAAPLVLGVPGTTRPRSVAAADLDGDGALDLVSANSIRDNLTVFFQLSPGGFAAAPLVLGGRGTTDVPFSVSAADLDGDGDQDIASANAVGGNLTIFSQLSLGSFAATPLTLSDPATTRRPVSVAATDLDGDEDVDLVSANEFSDNLTVFSQLSPGSFAAAPLVLGGPGTMDGPVSVAAVDLDGDGDQDLASANEVRDNLTIFLQLYASFSAAPLVLGGSGTTSLPDSGVAADFDGDGDLDLVSANEGGDNLTVFFQLSPGNFAVAPLLVGDSATTKEPRSVAAADLDGDGDQDLVSANVDSNDLTVFFQLSPGSFAAAPLFLGGSSTTRDPNAVVAADLDGDGDQDLVSANRRSDNLTVFFQLSPGSFVSAPLVLGGPATTNGPSSVVAADLDRDGDQDLVSANGFGDNLTVFFQLSPGSFAAVPLTLGNGITDSPSSVAAADLDGDGDRDLVSANNLGDNLTVFFQLSPGVFATTPLAIGGSGVMDSPNSVAAADLDGDGDNDLVSANLSDDSLTVFFQLSPGSFAAAPLELSTTNGPNSVAAVDLDGDGDHDLVSTNSNSLTVFFGGR